MIVKKLITLANILDSRGLLVEADYLDRIIKMASDDDINPPIFNERATFIDYDESLTELASTIALLADMPMGQEDWDSFGRQTVLEKISGFSKIKRIPKVS